MERMEARTWKAVMALLALLASASLAPGQGLVTGQVANEHGEPIEGAAVWVSPSPEPYDVAQMLVTATVRSGADGRFVLKHDAQADGLQVVAAARGRQSCAVWLHRAARAAGKDRPADIGQFVLPPGADLIGRVQDAKGEPVAGVRVAVTSAVMSLNAARQRVQSYGSSDARGIFRVPCVPRTGLRLTLSKLGFVTQVQLASHESPLSITMRPAPMVRGRLVEADGTPVTDATVTLLQEQLTGAPGASGAQADCAEDGSFALTAPLPPARYRVQAHRSSRPSARLLSKLLVGAQAELSLPDLVDPAGALPTLVVHVVDAKTGQRIPKFRLAVSHAGLADPGAALWLADGYFHSYEQQAVIPMRLTGDVAILVAAPGYAFGAEPAPQDLEAPMVIRLGPEAVVQGRVLDENGLPVVGAAVRALPDGSSKGSGNGGIDSRWPRTDAQGRYRVGGLRDGVYQVQAYPADGPGCAPQKVTVTTERVAELDLTVRSRREVTLELEGNLPEGPAPVVQVQFRRQRRRNYGFRVFRPAPAAVTLRRGVRSYPIGVQQGEKATLELFLPSRTRAGSGALIPFPAQKIVDGKLTLELPKLDRTILRGRIEVETRLPAARIAIVATPDDANKNRRIFGTRKIHGGVHADGSFALDVPAGSYVLQLVDVETQIVFHTEEEDVDADAEGLVLRPTLRWLEVNLTCEDPQELALVRSFKVQLDRPRDGACDAFAGRGYAGGDSAQSGVSPITLASKMRWLVPAGHVEITAQQSPRSLDRHQGRYYFNDAATASVEIEEDAKVEHSVTLTVPAPLSAAELERPRK